MDLTHKKTLQSILNWAVRLASKAPCWFSSHVLKKEFGVHYLDDKLRHLSHKFYPCVAQNINIPLIARQGKYCLKLGDFMEVTLFASPGRVIYQLQVILTHPQQNKYMISDTVAEVLSETAHQGLHELMNYEQPLWWYWVMSHMHSETCINNIHVYPWTDKLVIREQLWFQNGIPFHYVF